MGWHQIILFTVPRKSLIEEYGLWERNMLKERFEGRFEQIRAELTRLWALSDFNIMEIVHQIERMFTKKEIWEYETGGYSWKSKTYPIDNDAWIDFDSESNKIKEICIRPDVRNDENLDFFAKTLAFVQKYDLLMINMHGNIFEPTKQDCLEIFEIIFFGNDKEAKILKLFDGNRNC